MLYQPQIEQFKIKLRSQGDALFGRSASEYYDARVWILQIGQGCTVVSCDVFLKQDTTFLEGGKPSLCISSMSSDSLHLTPVALLGKPRAMENVAAMSTDIQEQRTTLRAGTRHRAVSLYVLPEYLKEFSRWIEEPGEICPEEIAASIRDDTRTLARYFSRTHAAQDNVPRCCEHAVRLVLSWRQERARAEMAAGTREQALLVRQAQAYLSSHLEKPLTLDTIARDLFVSRTRLCAAFRQESGESLGSHLRRMRLERACLLLTKRSDGIADIALQVGYPRASSFTVSFEKEFGVSPGAWRELHGRTRA